MPRNLTVVKVQQVRLDWLINVFCFHLQLETCQWGQLQNHKLHYINTVPADWFVYEKEKHQLAAVMWSVDIEFQVLKITSNFFSSSLATV